MTDYHLVAVVLCVANTIQIELNFIWHEYGMDFILVVLIVLGIVLLFKVIIIMRSVIIKIYISFVHWFISSFICLLNSNEIFLFFLFLFLFFNFNFNTLIKSQFIYRTIIVHKYTLSLSLSLSLH